MSNKGESPSKETRLKMSMAAKGRKPTPQAIAAATATIKGNFGADAHAWKGDAVGYRGLHYWVASILGKPDTCERCGASGLSGRFIHWANKSGKYIRDITDWMRLCASCHAKNDRLIRNLKRAICV